MLRPPTEHCLLQAVALEPLTVAGNSWQHLDMYTLASPHPASDLYLLDHVYKHHPVRNSSLC